MTHVLCDPFYPSDLSKYVDSGIIPSRSTSRIGITQEKFDRIRSHSRHSWGGHLDYSDNEQPHSRFTSSYSAHYQRPTREYVVQRTKSRPTSPTRKNRPHPPMPFLVWHLHDAPGFEKANAGGGSGTLQKPYKVGHREEKGKINQTKLVHHSTPQVSGTSKDDVQVLQATLSDEAQPKAEAWFKQASAKDKELVLRMLKTCADQKYIGKKADQVMKPEATAALNRYLKRAGRDEEDAMARLFKTLSFDPYETNYIDKRLLDKQDPDRYSLRKYTTQKSKTGRYETESVVTRKTPYRDDFKIHPEWR